MKIAFIGGGLMAEAMLRGILHRGVALPKEVWIGEPVETRRDYLGKTHGVLVAGDNVEAARHGELVILSVKPQNLPEVLKELEGTLQPEQVALSIVAGARMETIASGLRHEKTVRVMPNTPAQVGEGMTLWLARDAVEPGFREAIRSILQALGHELQVHDEKYLDMATALSASGPAYVFLFIESLIEAGVYMGMSRDMARELAVQTVVGSARLTYETDKHPAELKDMVTSPGGTTAEALRSLEERGFRATIMNSVIAAFEKSRRLGEQEHRGSTVY